MFKKSLIVFSVLVMISNLSLAQKIDLGEFEMEIIEAFSKNSVGTAFTLPKKKYVGLEVLLIPKSKKNSGLDLDDMKLKSETDEYYLIHKKGLTVHLLEGVIIKLRRPKKIMIFAEIKKDLTNATLHYKDKAVVSIEVNNSGKIGSYKILE